MAQPLVSVDLIGDEKLLKYLKKLEKNEVVELKREIKRSGQVIYNKYFKFIKGHHKTGATEKLIVIEVSKNGFQVEVGALKSTVPVPVFLEFGTKDHLITTRKKKVLATPSSNYTGTANAYGSGKLPMYSKDGAWVIFGMHVDHPGTPANAYLLKSWISAMVPNKFSTRLKKRFDAIK